VKNILELEEKLDKCLSIFGSFFVLPVHQANDVPLKLKFPDAEGKGKKVRRGRILIYSN
jgi:hypothetical protein